MRRTIAAVGMVVALLFLVAPTPALATAAHGRGYETGDLACGSTTYTVLATGFGASFRVVDATTVLVFRSGTLTDLATGVSVTFGPYGTPEGVTPVRCTGILTNPVFDLTYAVEFFMSIGP
jgi:hypothetical protein